MPGPRRQGHARHASAFAVYLLPSRRCSLINRPRTHRRPPKRHKPTHHVAAARPAACRPHRPFAAPPATRLPRPPAAAKWLGTFETPGRPVHPASQRVRCHPPAPPPYATPQLPRHPAFHACKRAACACVTEAGVARFPPGAAERCAPPRRVPEPPHLHMRTTLETMGDAAELIQGLFRHEPAKPAKFLVGDSPLPRSTNSR